MSRNQYVISLLVVGLVSGIAACAPVENCVEPAFPYVLKEGVYEKFGDPAIVMREQCKAQKAVAPIELPASNPSPSDPTDPVDPVDPPPQFPELGQPNTQGERGGLND